ncbi:hypothetical protein [Agromyces bauzanensis]|uniref:hypothetical protein n=1 Tax=Agromyces bauzanensis TaxID=1308924 RepID=UPI00166AFDE2|nr:hypothetical protein [Agromyces bauzanensis]
MKSVDRDGHAGIRPSIAATRMSVRLSIGMGWMGFSRKPTVANTGRVCTVRLRWSMTWSPRP